MRQIRVKLLAHTMTHMKTKLFAFLTLLQMAVPALAVDSYRYAHVTIETPWMIFIFLLMVILLPFILSAILYWYFATKKPEANGSEKE